ncbi:hypothetical protein Halha_2618 [Halobacteroides halobius DSM 5150]|uniref:Cell division protein FtsL n=1 Tax=Halobacteroides halobius (strain ATCC 35273 / DSM 5150 / MD-1) TaxID=748449 RepID=L0KBV3_HALHC|nr:hypothetical protein [Halobacteroides halobius]AGB42491.1 hypothetical protein Halha_2618 [Halobacteroides halobius DSM 5150]
MFSEKQRKEYTFQIIPHVSRDIFKVGLSKKIVKIIISCLLIGLIALVGSLCYYYYSYNNSLERIDNLILFKEKNKELISNNQYLYNELIEISNETEKINKVLNQLKKEDYKIRKIIDFNS